MTSIQGHKNALFVACFLFFIAFSSNAQDPIYIRHDFLTQKTIYYKLSGADTVWLTHLKVKKKQAFIVDVQNVNTFYYNGNMNLEKRTQEAFNSKTIFAPFSILTKTYSGAFSGILPIIEKIRTTRGKAESVMQSKATSLLSSFEDVYQRLRQDDAFYKRLQINEAYLSFLKRDLTKTEQQIKQEAKTYMETNLPSLLSSWEQKKLPETKNDMYLKLRLDSVKMLYQELTALKTETTEDFNVDGETFITKFQKTGYYYAQIMNLAETEYKNGDEFTKKLNAIYNSYDDIANASFRYSFKTDCSNETAGIKLAVYPKSADDGKDTVYRYFEVNKPTYGLRLRNSIGVAFSFFKDANRSYFVKLDSTVGSSQGDRFNPMIASFLHLNFTRSETIKPGVLLGIGIPLTNERNINFLAGGSLILGKNENFYFSAGVAGAKVNKLDRGLKPGDRVPNRDYSLPYKSFYDLGFFVSLSFNLNVLNNSK